MNFATEVRSRALTRLVNATKNPDVRKINVIAPHSIALPDMGAFSLIEEGTVGKNRVLTYARE